MKATAIRVLVVDDHSVVRMGLVALIEGERDMLCAGEATSGEEGVARHRELRPDVTLIDLRLPGIDGATAIAEILHETAGARFVVLSSYEGDEDIHRALRAGAQAYVLKSMTATDVVAAIRAVHAGRRWVPPGVAARLAEREGQPDLTTRELEVLRLVAEGLDNGEIADVLEIAYGTVKVHLKNIFAKLEVEDRTEAAAVALRRGLVRLG